jgi:hypothetical protein
MDEMAPHPPPEVPTPDGVEARERRPPLVRREQAAADALRALMRDIQTYHFGAYSGPAELRLPLEVAVRPLENWALRFDPPLETQVLEQLQEAQAERMAPLPGRVYCYRCRSSTCAHARPPDPLQVFFGYSQTGEPEWRELAQALIHWGDDRTDQLFGSPPAILARMLYGRPLRERQLASFGRASKTYAILAQTVAGYFPLRSPSGGPPQRLALTFQAVESRTPGGDLRLTLNVIGGLSEPAVLDELLADDRGWAPVVFRAKEIAARAIQEIERKTRLAREGHRRDEASRLMRQVPVVLSRLAESLERGERQRKRRTQHAEDRRSAGTRPVHTALQDALALAPEGWHEDTRTGARVAVTPEGRAHLFSETGRHITSFLLEAPALEHRLRIGRWRKLEASEALRFREHLRSPPAGSDGSDSSQRAE